MYARESQFPDKMFSGENVKSGLSATRRERIKKNQEQFNLINISRKNLLLNQTLCLFFFLLLFRIAKFTHKNGWLLIISDKISAYSEKMGRPFLYVSKHTRGFPFQVKKDGYNSNK